MLSYLKTSWFWLGIWVFYYLRFTNYAGIGIIESVLYITMTTAEIPTGAIADLFGKRKTLMMSFLVMAIGNIFMGLTPNFIFLVLSVFIAAIGGALYSGTLDALVYDSLKEENKESLYDKIYSKINSLQLISMAIAGVIGGFMYTINPGFPFIAAGIFYVLGFILCFLLKEPNIDTVKFSFSNFIFQNKQGLRELFKTADLKKITILLLSVGSILIISDEMLNDILAVEFGFTAIQLGIFASVIALITAGFSQLTPYIRNKITDAKIIIVIGIFVAITFMISPLVGIIIGGISLIIRSCLQTTYHNMASIMINKNTESKYRATTISTYNMIKNLPYVLSAFILGSLMDFFTAKNFAFALGLLLISLTMIQAVKLRKEINIGFLHG